jgi:hypothetical protein
MPHFTRGPPAPVALHPRSCPLLAAVVFRSPSLFTCSPFPIASMPHPSSSGSYRITVTLPERVAKRIGDISYYQGRSMSNLVAYLVERGIEHFPLN